MINKEKFFRSVLCSVVGDAYGYPYEKIGNNVGSSVVREELFFDWDKTVGGRFYGHSESHKAGSYSDDTQMILMNLRSLFFPNYEEEYLKKVELHKWSSYARGAGRAVTKASKAVLEHSNIPKKDFLNAGGNGTAMRMIPIILKYLDGDLNYLIQKVYKNALVTHGHPRALLGASLQAYVCYLIYKYDFTDFKDLFANILRDIDIWSQIPNNYYDIDSEEWGKCSNNIIFKLTRILQGYESLSMNECIELLGATGDLKGACDICVITSIYLYSKFHNDIIKGIRYIGSKEGVDTDTLACILGGFLGLHSKDDSWITDEVKQVQDYNYLVNLVDRIYTPNNVENLEDYIGKDGYIKDKLSIKTKLKDSFECEDSVFGIVRVANIEVNKTKQDNLYNIRKTCYTQEGQTLYINENYKKDELINLLSLLESKNLIDKA